MHPISAADSVSLAIQRTREFLFRPFAWGSYLKLGLVAIVTEGIGSNLHSSTRGAHPNEHPPMVFSPFNIPPEWVPRIVAVAALAVVLGVVVFYLVTRLRFAFFHCVIHNTREIRPGWELYREQAMRFCWLSIKVGFCFLLLFALAVLPFVPGILRLVHEIQQSGHPDVRSMLSLALPLIPIILLMALAGVLIDVVLRDWMLPHIALEDATAGEAWEEVWERIKAEKLQFSVYALLRLILPGIAVAALLIALLVPGLMIAGSAAAMGYTIHSAFAGSTGTPAIVGLSLEVFFGVVAFGFALLAGVCLGGPLSTGIREYALIFYGGRYKELGEILYPPSAAGISTNP